MDRRGEAGPQVALTLPLLTAYDPHVTGARRSAGSAAREVERTPTDVALIERCLGGESAAWEEIVARFKRRVFNIAFKFTGRHDVAEDLTQEIFLKVFRGLERFKRDADFTTWLSSVARNYCIDHYRSVRREREVMTPDNAAVDVASDHGVSPLRKLEDEDRRALLRAGLDQLPPKLREAVVLRDLQEMTYQEMAERLSLPEGTVKSRINRGREELARLLRRARQPPRSARRGEEPFRTATGKETR